MKSALLVLTLSLTAVLAHMQLNYPAPFGAANNPHRTDPADPYLQYPFNCCGRKTPFPCGGHLNLLGTPQGAPVASWAAGSSQNFSLIGIGNHYGGSCQVGFSVDNGKTFQVATSYQGNCPHRKGGESADGQTFDFTVPADIPTGDVVFAWTWYNREQEFNMNCAAITITPSVSSRTTDPAPPVKPADPAPAPSSSSYTDRNGCTCTCPATNFKPAPAPRALHAHKRAHAHGVPDLVARTDTPAAPTVPYHQRPGFLIADTGNGCQTPHSTAEVKFPNPGPDVVQGDGEYPLELPGPGGMCGY